MKKLFLILSLLLPGLGFSQGTAFTYQGVLSQNGAAVSGSNDLTFTLYTAVSGGSIVGASNIVSDLRMTNGLFTVTLDFGASPFQGNNRWLEIAVRPGASTGAYTNLVPRQPITATPYALFAAAANASTLIGSIPSTSLAGTYGVAVTLNNAGNVFVGNGSNLTALNASQLTSGTVPAAALSNAWKITGNSNTTPGTHFLGTTDNKALEFKVNNQRGLRLEHKTGVFVAEGVNVIGGYGGNSVGSAIGATVFGGGIDDFFFVAKPNEATGDFASVVGGLDNRASEYSATIGGGNGNRASEHGATIGGGQVNTASGLFATVGGGQANHASGERSTIPGGYLNTATDYAFAAGRRAGANHLGAFVWADSADADFVSTADNQFLIRASGGVAIGTSNPAGAALRVVGSIKADSFLGAGTTLVLGTTDNQPVEFKVNNQRALRLEDNGDSINDADAIPDGAPNVIGGSPVNFVSVGSVGATIGGGGATHWNGASSSNAVNADFGTISGGLGNLIAVSGYFSTIAGGEDNDIGINSDSSAIGGGYNNSIGGNSPYATIAGGRNNAANGPYATVGGGSGNTAVDYATVGGGSGNSASHVSTTVAGGSGNIASQQRASVGGGFQNSASGHTSTVGGGQDNVASGLYATIPGGVNNAAANQAFAAGSRAKANHTGTFVWSDATGADFVSTANNQFLIRASGGVAIGTNDSDGAALRVVGSIKADGFSGMGSTLTLGTTDNQPLELKVNGQRVLRLEPTTSSPNVVGGIVGNAIDAGVVGAVIAGGGDGSTANKITNAANYAAVGGGKGNAVGGPASVIAGGDRNAASGQIAAIGGGQFNSAAANYSVIPGGANNAVGASGTYALAAGQRAKANHQGAFVWADSTAADFASTANNQFNVRATGGARLETGGAGLTVDGSSVALRTGGNNFTGQQTITGGQVGIGTISPMSSIGYPFGWDGLHTRSAANNGLHVIQGANSARLHLRTDNNITNVAQDFIIANYLNRIDFEWLGAGLADRLIAMTMTTNGNVGIGTGTAPTSKLEVAGTVAASGLRAPGAGINTGTFAFTHRATAGSISGVNTLIVNPLCDGDPDAILTVTHHYGKDTSANRAHPQVVGVYYTGLNWVIFNEDGSPMEVGDAFNVMVIKP